MVLLASMYKYPDSLPAQFLSIKVLSPQEQFAIDLLLTTLHSLILSVLNFNLMLFYFAGWGGPGGYVYQKAYLEFFCSKDKLISITENCKALPSLTYIAVNKEGEYVSNVVLNAVNAVTWGVFPGKEIIQPTVVDPASFMIWKDEAFEIWTRGWARLFPEGDPSRELLAQVFLYSGLI